MRELLTVSRSTGFTRCCYPLPTSGNARLTRNEWKDNNLRRADACCPETNISAKRSQGAPHATSRRRKDQGGAGPHRGDKDYYVTRCYYFSP